MTATVLLFLLAALAWMAYFCLGPTPCLFFSASFCTGFAVATGIAEAMER